MVEGAPRGRYTSHMYLMVHGFTLLYMRAAVQQCCGAAVVLIFARINVSYCVDYTVSLHSCIFPGMYVGMNKASCCNSALLYYTSILAVSTPPCIDESMPRSDRFRIFGACRWDVVPT